MGGRVVREFHTDAADPRRPGMVYRSSYLGETVEVLSVSTFLGMAYYDGYVHPSRCWEERSLPDGRVRFHGTGWDRRNVLPTSGYSRFVSGGESCTGVNTVHGR